MYSLLDKFFGLDSAEGQAAVRREREKLDREIAAFAADPDGRPTRVTVFTIGGRDGMGLPWAEKQPEPSHRFLVSGGGWSMEAKTRIGRYRIDYFDKRKPGDQILLSFPLGGSVMCADEDAAKASAADHLRGVIEDLTSHL